MILTPQAMTDPVHDRRKAAATCALLGKPVLASWMGGSSVAAGRSILSGAGIPLFDYPDEAVEAFLYMWRYAYNLRGIYETPSLVTGANEDIGRARVTEIIDSVRRSNRTILTEVESKHLLAAAGIPTLETLVAKSEDEAVAHAESLGYPVVLKLHSYTITHKTDVGGVVLNLANNQAVRQAFERIRQSVSQRAGGEHFVGVAVQRMVAPFRV